MAKPVSKPDWTVGNPDFATVTQEPTGAKKIAGWLPSEKPPREFMNWLFWNIDAWIDYFDSSFDNLGVGDDLVVGTGTSQYASLALALAAATAGKRIYVTISETVNSTITVAVNDVEIMFKPGCTYSKGTASNGLLITADRVKIQGGRWTGFSGGSDKAIECSSSAEYTQLRDIRFSDNTVDISDLGVGTTSDGCLDEDTNPNDVQRKVTINNSQGSQIDITGVVFNKLKVVSAQFHYWMDRHTTTETRNTCGTIYLNYDGVNDLWYARVQEYGDSSGVEFSVTATGQLQYLSDTVSGSSYSGEIRLALTGLIRR